MADSNTLKIVLEDSASSSGAAGSASSRNKEPTFQSSKRIADLQEKGMPSPIGVPKPSMGPIGSALAAFAAAAVVVKAFTSAMDFATKITEINTNEAKTRIMNQRVNQSGINRQRWEATGDAIPLIGGLVSSFGRLITAKGIKNFELSNALLERAMQLSSVSGPIAAAQSRSDVRGIMADVREGQELGDKMAELIDAQNRLLMAQREESLGMKMNELNKQIKDLNDKAESIEKKMGKKPDERIDDGFDQFMIDLRGSPLGGRD